MNSNVQIILFIILGISVLIAIVIPLVNRPACPDSCPAGEQGKQGKQGKQGEQGLTDIGAMTDRQRNNLETLTIDAKKRGVNFGGVQIGVEKQDEEEITEVLDTRKDEEIREILDSI